MDFFIQFVKDNFVIIALFIGALLLINLIVKKLLPLLGGILLVGLLFYGFTGDATFLNKTVDASTQAVDAVKSEVGTATFERTSATTFVVKTKTMTITGDETTKLATVTTGEKTVEIPLKSLYKLLSEDIQKQITMN